MRTLISLFLIALVAVQVTFAQSPQKLNYQAVVRNTDSSPVVSTEVRFRFSIVIPTKGMTDFEEVHLVTTNDYGLVNVRIGEVDPVSFAELDWHSYEYQLKVECDPTGGTNYTIVETKDLASVPYALHAGTADKTLGDSLWKQSGSNIYYTDGSVGIGNSNPSSSLDITATAIPDTPENILTASVSDDPNSYLRIRNGTLSDGKFMPAIVGFNGTDHRQGLFFTANTTDALDDLAGYPLITFDARREEAEIVNRPLFQWSSYGNHKMTMLANGNLGIGTTDPREMLDVNGNALIRGSIQTGTPNIEINAYGSGNRYAFIDFHGDDENPDYSLRIIRNNTGVNANSKIHHMGLGSLQLVTANAGPIDFYTEQAHRMRIDGTGKVGIGTSTPTSKVQVQGEPTWSDEDPLFEVKNSEGTPVFAVYNNGVQILVEDDPLKKGPKGGFAIGGFDPTKAGETYDFMRITPDSIRFNINNEASKGPKGGFAIGGFDRTKSDLNEDFMYVTPQNSNAGKYNTFLGYLSGENNSGEHNTFLGSYTGNLNENGSYNNFIGLNAGLNNTSGSSNCFIGNGAGMENTQGYGNVFVGNGAGVNNTEGFNNVYIGTNAGLWQTEGDYNIIIGPQWSGSVKPIRHRTIKIGAKAGFDDTGSDRLFIDGSTGGTTYTSSLIYGYYGAGTKKVRINGNLEYTGSSGQVSDKRLKTNIVCINDVLDKLSSISGYYFDWNEIARENLVIPDGKQIGMIAQELETVFPELVFENDEGYKNINYTQLTPVLLQAVKEQQSQIVNQQKDISDLKAQITLLQQMVMEMAAREE